MFKMFNQNNLFRILFIVGIFFFANNLVLAENQVYLLGPSNVLTPGSEFGIKIMIDTDDEINALDLEFDYTTDSLEFLSIDNTGSIIDALASIAYSA